jgi:hypothetical protein
MAKNKQSRGKGTKESTAPVKSEKPASEPSGDPLRAFPADPPQPNRVLLIISAVLFAIWFCFLAYVALRG